MEITIGQEKYTAGPHIGCTKKTSPVSLFDSLWLYKEDSPVYLDSLWLYKEDLSCIPPRFSLAVQRRSLLYSSLNLFGCTKKTCPVLLFDSLWLYKEDLSCVPLQFSLVYKEDLSFMPLRFSLAVQRRLARVLLRSSLLYKEDFSLAMKHASIPGVWPEVVCYPVPGAGGRERRPLLPRPVQPRDPHK